MLWLENIICLVWLGAEWLPFKNYKNIVYLLTGKLDFSLVNVKFREI